MTIEELKAKMPWIDGGGEGLDGVDVAEGWCGMIVEFSKHKDSNARGRNGYFIPAEAFVNGWMEQKGAFPSPALVNINVYSKRGARTEPIMLRLTLEDAKKLQDAIGIAISEAAT